MEFKKKVYEKVWRDFVEPTFETIESEDYISLAEAILQEESKNEMWQKYNNIKVDMRLVLGNLELKPCFIDKKDQSHTNRILYYLDSLLFDKKCPADQEECHAIFKLDTDTLFVLLCAAQLHDYGKVRWQLTRYSLLKDVAEEMEKTDKLLFDHYNQDNKILQNILREIGEIRNKAIGGGTQRSLAAVDKLFSKLNGISINELQLCDMGYIEDYHTRNVYLFLNAVIYAKEIDKFLDTFFYDNKIILKQSYDHKLFEDLKSINADHLKKIKTVASSHKAFKPYGLEARDEYFENSGSEKVLCALLRLADSLDFDRQRVVVSEKRDLSALLYEMYEKWDQEELCDNLVKVFSIWTRFLLVKRIDIDHHLSKKGDYRIDIVTNYYRFPHSEEFFFTLRQMAEKDFTDERFLRVIQKSAVVPIKINLLYRVLNETNDRYPNIDIRGKIRNVYEKAKQENSSRAKKGTDREGLERFFHKIPEMSQTFIPFSIEAITMITDKCLYLPRNFDFYFYLNSLKDAAVIRPDDLGKVTPFGGIQDLTNGAKHEYEAHGLFEKIGDTTNYTFSSIAARAIKDLFKIANRHPILLKSKIDEVKKTGSLMPFSRIEGSPGVFTGIPGLSDVIPGWKESAGEIKHSRNILVKGGPGTGKTTFALQIFFHNITDNEEYVGRQALYITFEEDPTRIALESMDSFKWNIRKEQIAHFKRWEREFENASDARQFARILMEKIQEYHADVLFIDSLNRLQTFIKNIKTKIDFKETIRAIFDEVEMWHMTAFYVLEDDESRFEEYAADGIIYLDHIRGQRSIEIRKLRNQKFIPGQHSFKIVDQRDFDGSGHFQRTWLVPGINIFPNTRTYAERLGGLRDVVERQVVPSGIVGLDDLLPVSREMDGHQTGGYLRRNIILVIGSPGSGKTIFGLHFVKKGIDMGEKCLWISFEGTRAALKFTVGGFHSDLGFNGVFEDEENDNFLFHYFSPAYFNHDELIFAIKKMVKSTVPYASRLVIDSVSEIESLFQRENDFKNFMGIVIDELRKLDITTIFLYRSAGFFGFQKQTHTPISSLVDTVISIKTFDIKNRIKKGLFVLKSRGREQRSKLQTMDILYEKGIVVTDKGWEYEGMLSGETGEIKEPYIFLKLFYENPAETRVNDYMIADFTGRYPMGSRLFTSVRKSHIYSEFWSFKGNFGAGHANIRVVSLNKHMVEAFRENDRLHILDEYFSPSLWEDIKSDQRYSTYYNKDKKFDFLPCYSDFGVLVFQPHLVEKAHVKVDATQNWETLLVEAKSAADNLVRGGNRAFAFAMPPLDNVSEFVAFFMEILWTFGGDLYRFPPHAQRNNPEQTSRLSFYRSLILGNEQVRHRVENMMKVHNLPPDLRKSFEKTLKDVEPSNSFDNVISITDARAKRALKFLCGLVVNGYSPNPYQGDMRPYSILSRKWYSQVQEFRAHISAISEGKEFDYKLKRENNIKKDGDGNTSGNNEDLGTSYIKVELHKLPYWKTTMMSVTNQAIWCLSIIKDALSPEIGWIFIDSMVSPEIRRKRSAERTGFPIRLKDIRSNTYRWADEDIYHKVAEILETDRNSDNKTEQLGTLFDLTTGEEECITAVTNLNDACSGKDIQNVVVKLWQNRAQLNNGHLIERLKLILSSFYTITGNGGVFNMAEAGENEVKAIIEAVNDKYCRHDQYRVEFKFREGRTTPLYISKLCANRPYFYRIEPIIHRHVRNIFSELNQLFEDNRLTKEEALAKAIENAEERVGAALDAIRDDLIVTIFRNP